MSRRPGIGSEWYKTYSSDIFPSDEVPVPGKGVIKGVPRFYEELLKENDPELHEKIKAQRKVFMAEHGDDYTPSRLMQRYKVKKAQLAMLKREL